MNAVSMDTVMCDSGGGFWVVPFGYIPWYLLCFADIVALLRIAACFCGRDSNIFAMFPG